MEILKATRVNHIFTSEFRGDPVRVFVHEKRDSRFQNAIRESCCRGGAQHPHLAALRHLTSLNLAGTEVGDAGLRKLGKCKTLRDLYLWNSSVTRLGAETIRRQLREAKVSL